MRISIQDQGLKKLTTPLKYRDRQAYKLISRGLFFEHNLRGIGSAFHRATEEIGQKDHLWMGNI